MANKKLDLDITQLNEEYDMLKDELVSLDDLFDESKNRLDQVAKVPSRANPVFMSSQTANLISIKEKKINIIKELTNIKKAKLEIEMKVFNANNKLDEVESGVSKEILDIYRLLNKNDKMLMLEEAMNEPEENEEEQLTNEEIENIFEERLNLDTQEKKKKKKKEQTLPSEYSIVVTKEKEFFIVDEYYNIIEDCDFDTSVINITDFGEDENGDEVAYDEDGNVYEVVEL